MQRENNGKKIMRIGTQTLTLLDEPYVEVEEEEVTTQVHEPADQKRMKGHESASEGPPSNLFSPPLPSC